MQNNSHLFPTPPPNFQIQSQNTRSMLAGEKQTEKFAPFKKNKMQKVVSVVRMTPGF